MPRKTKSGENAFAELDKLQESTDQKQTKADAMAEKTPEAPKKKSTRKKKAEAIVEEAKPDKTVMLGVRVTPDEKMRLQIYCAKNRVTQERVIRDFISGLEV